MSVSLFDYKTVAPLKFSLELNLVVQNAPNLEYNANCKVMYLNREYSKKISARETIDSTYPEADVMVTIPSKGPISKAISLPKYSPVPSCGLTEANVRYELKTGRNNNQDW